jgi:CheY-like chemotaxis protein
VGWKEICFSAFIEKKLVFFGENMPDIIMPDDLAGGEKHAPLKWLLVVSGQSINASLMQTLASTLPALIMLVHSSKEALKVTEKIVPDVLLLTANGSDMSGIECYHQLCTRSALTGLPTIIVDTFPSF